MMTITDQNFYCALRNDHHMYAHGPVDQLSLGNEIIDNSYHISLQ